MSELCDTGARELRRLIGVKQLSPVELLQACKQRIKSIDPALNAIPHTCWKRAEKEAQAAQDKARRGEPLGALHGLPIVIKDTQLTEGVRSTLGSPIYAHNVPAADEQMVAAVRAAGAIVIGKSNVPEFGAGANSTNPVYGTTVNPYDLARTCGGSSGGSAVALATSMVPLATGSDTGGSLRIPAALCGVVGMRPTPGLVPRGGRTPGWTPISVYGPIARSVSEAALMLSVIAGYDPRDPLSVPVDAASFADPPAVDLASLRVAWSEDLGFAPVERVQREALRRAVDGVGSCFATLEKKDPPLDDADWIFEVIRASQFVAGHMQHYREHRDLLGPNLVENLEQALTFNFEDMAMAQAAHGALYRRFLDYMDAFDVLLCPVTGAPAFAKETLSPAIIDGIQARTYFHWLAPAYGITLTAHPAISIPCGVDANGLPFGLQIVGKRGEDRRLLGIAAALEAQIEAQPALKRKHPDLASLVEGAT
jgi:amidase